MKCSARFASQEPYCWWGPSQPVTYSRRTNQKNPILTECHQEECITNKFPRGGEVTHPVITDGRRQKVSRKFVPDFYSLLRKKVRRKS